jgi:AraC-like DNA-binding protein
MARGAPLRSEANTQLAVQLPVVVACLAERKAQWCVQDALRGRAAVCLVKSLAELNTVLRHETAVIAAVIVGSRDASGAMAAPVVREITARTPSLVLVAYCKAGIEHSPDIRALAAAGVHEFLFQGVDDSGVALRAVLAAAGRTCAAETVMAAVRPHLPIQLHRFAEYCLSYPEQVLSVSAVAKMLGEHRKTVFNHCIEQGLPPPSELLVWCRLLLAAHLLASTTRTIESVALELEFPSDTSLRNMMKRHTGLTASEARDRGGMACVLDALKSRLAQTRTA